MHCLSNIYYSVSIYLFLARGFVFFLIFCERQCFDLNILVLYHKYIFYLNSNKVLVLGLLVDQLVENSLSIREPIKKKSAIIDYSVCRPYINILLRR